MRITEIRTRVVEWRGKKKPCRFHRTFATNPMEPALIAAGVPWGTFTFHGWLIVENFSLMRGLVGLGNCRPFSPRITKQVIDLYLKTAVDWRRPVGHRISLAAHVSENDGIWPQRHWPWCHQRRGHRIVGTLLGKSARPAGFIVSSAAARKPRIIPSMRAACNRRAPSNQPGSRKPASYKEEGYKAMKLRLRLGDPPMEAEGYATQLWLSSGRCAKAVARGLMSMGRCLHGLDTGLRETNAPAARAFQSALAGGKAVIPD